MQFDKGRSNGNSYGYDPYEDLTTTPVKYRPMTSSGNGNGNGNGLKYIEHMVSKMDTLAGVAIKYGVEVADIKRMNGLVSDLQMFALKSLQIPLPGRHPPSPVLSNGSATPGRQKADTDIGSHTLNMPLMEDNGGGSGFSSITGKGLALRPKSSSRIALAADADAVPVGLGDSVVTSLFDGVRKSSSTSNLQDQESNGSSIWMASKWSLKPDLQAAASLARPIFDGLPKPMTGRRSKAALD
ncbi:hypothetical protein IFM89_007737 [Coptis chinensis]|uniref:LysM domain-containing protein n=1 Tax=Coptis chinensis TaxID=261450 RepID=A0A835MEE9_9MAGN|nr:hypothetical protein IFM89_007737 [Coptis chinensis]